MLRAKVKCISVEKIVNNYKPENQPFLFTAKFAAVYSQDPESENKKFWDATPSAAIQLTSILQDAFEVGQEYYLDFSVAS